MSSAAVPSYRLQRSMNSKGYLVASKQQKPEVQLRLERVSLIGKRSVQQNVHLIRPAQFGSSQRQLETSVRSNIEIIGQ